MKKLLALALCMALCLALCACASQPAPDSASDTYIAGALGKDDAPAEQPKTDKPEKPEKPEKEDDKVPIKTPSIEDKFMATITTAVQETTAQVFSNDAGTSIDVLREEITSAGAVFGVAYVGFFEYFEETGIDFAQWYEGAASPFAAYYPFFMEIDENHTIGEGGYLYCILAGDYESSITVTDQSGEMLYSAENGDPILLFCDRGGNGQNADLTVTITSADGTSLTYGPALDQQEYPQLLIGDERQLLSWIIQGAEESTISFDALLLEGWLGMNAYGLAGDDVFAPRTWTICMWDEEKQTMVDFSLSFCPNPPEGGAVDGEVLMQSFYEGVSGVQGEWEGWWRVETELDQPSVLQLDLMLMRGDDMAHYEAVPTLSETFWAMIHPNGEILLLMPQSGYSDLPFMGEGVSGVELALSMG